MSTATIDPAVRPADKVELKLGLNFPALTAAYCIWQSSGLFESIFFRHPTMTLWEFLSWNYQPTAEPVGCYIGEKMVGIGWICKAFKFGDRVVAEVGAAFFEGTPLSVWHRALDLFLAHAFVDRGFAEIYGISSRANQQAEAITRWCGMKPVGGVPWPEEIPVEAAVYRLTREEWQANNSRRAA